MSGFTSAANQEEAKRCVEVAIDAYNGGDLSKALRLFKKAANMHKTIQALKWIEKVEKELSSPASSSSSRYSSSSTSSLPSSTTIPLNTSPSRPQTSIFSSLPQVLDTVWEPFPFVDRQHRKALSVIVLAIFFLIL